MSYIKGLWKCDLHPWLLRKRKHKRMRDQRACRGLTHLPWTVTPPVIFSTMLMVQDSWAQSGIAHIPSPQNKVNKIIKDNEMSRSENIIFKKERKQPTNVGERWWKGSLIDCWWDYDLIWTLLKTVPQLFTKLKAELSHDPAISLLGFYLKNSKSTSPEGHMHTFVYCNIIHNHQGLGTLKCPTAE